MMEEPREQTNAQIAELAAKLIHTQADAREVCREMFEEELEPVGVDRLGVRRLADGSNGIFQCESCRIWRDVRERDIETDADICGDCGDEQREDED